MVSLVKRLEEAHRRAIDLLWFVEEDDILKWSDGGIVTLGEEEEELEEEKEVKAATMLKPGKGTSRRLVAPEEEEKRAEFPPPSPKFQSTEPGFGTIISLYR